MIVFECPICGKDIYDVWNGCFHKLGEYGVLYLPDNRTQVQAVIPVTWKFGYTSRSMLENRVVLELDGLVFLTVERIEKLLLLG